jgi:cysteine dioxygenase
VVLPPPGYFDVSGPLPSGLAVASRLVVFLPAMPHPREVSSKARASLRYDVSMASIDDFVAGLSAIPERDFTVPGVARFLADNPVDPASLEKYLFYEATHYTRNLIHKSDLFELLAVCWESGQSSPVHNHQGQHCWMAVPIGRLAVQNYDLVRADEQGFCELRLAERLVMDPGHPAFVDPEEPIHAVLNLAEYGRRATSLHVYSRPYDRCVVYAPEKNAYWEVPLFYDSEHGRRTPRTLSASGGSAPESSARR